jgi:hypothetical protein
VLVQALAGLAAPIGCVPGTSSVCASLNMPKFHLRRGAASLSPADMAGPVVVIVVLLAVVAGGCSFRQGVMLTMVGGGSAGGSTLKKDEQRMEYPVQEREKYASWERARLALDGMRADGLLSHEDAAAYALGQPTRAPDRYKEQMISGGPSIFTADAAV